MWKKILGIYHHIPNEKWSLPRGFAELENQKVKLIRKEADPNMMTMPTSEEIEIKNKSSTILCRLQ